MPITSTHRRAWNVVFNWLPLLVWMAVIYWLSAQPKLPHPVRKLGLSDYMFDYGSHAFTFGLLAWLAWRVVHGPASPLSAIRRFSPLGAAGLFSAFYALMDEVHQFFVPGRWASPKDWLADMVGVLAVIGLLAWWQRWRRRVATG